MKNEALYNRTLNIIISGYMNDTLMRGKCAACVIGNMIAANLGLRVHKQQNYLFDIENDGFNFLWKDANGRTVPHVWHRVFQTAYMGREFIQRFNPLTYCSDEDVKRQVDATGYSLIQAALIEWTFEKKFEEVKDTSDDPTFDALMSVVDVLDFIHENYDEEVTHTSKCKFAKQKQFIHENTLSVSASSSILTIASEMGV